MIKIPPCDLPMVPLVPMVWYHWQQKNIQGFLVTIGKNGNIGRFADFTVGKTPKVATVNEIVL